MVCKARVGPFKTTWLCLPAFVTWTILILYIHASQPCPAMTLERMYSMQGVCWMFSSDYTGGTLVPLKNRWVCYSARMTFFVLSVICGSVFYTCKIFLSFPPSLGCPWTFSCPYILFGRGARLSTQGHSPVWHAVPRGKFLFTCHANKGAGVKRIFGAVLRTAEK